MQKKNVFLTAFKEVLEEFGVQNIEKSKLFIIETMNTSKEVSSFISLIGDVRGNFSFSMSKDSAKKLSKLFMDFDFNEIDESVRGIIGEMANLISGKTASIFSGDGIVFDISVPTVVSGNDMYFQISSVDSIGVDIRTSIGEFEVNIAIE